MIRHFVRQHNCSGRACVCVDCRHLQSTRPCRSMHSLHIHHIYALHNSLMANDNDQSFCFVGWWRLNATRPNSQRVCIINCYEWDARVWLVGMSSAWMLIKPLSLKCQNYHRYTFRECGYPHTLLPDCLFTKHWHHQSGYFALGQFRSD